MISPLLKRQLKEAGLDENTLPSDQESWQEFLSHIDQTYNDNEQDGCLLERSFSDASVKVQALYESLRAHSESQLQFERDRFREVINALRDGFCLLSPDGTVKHMNPAAESILGVIDKSDESILNRFFIKYPNSSKPRSIREVCTLLADGKVVGDENAQLHDANGQTLDVSVLLYPIGTGENSEYALIWRDTTIRKRTEKEMRHAKELAESANRAKSDFLAKMSHEIRTPLNAVLGMTEILLNTHLDKMQEEYLDTIHTSGGQLLTVINDILDLSKIEAGKVELDNKPFDLIEKINEVCALMKPLALAKGLWPKRYLPENLPLVEGDAGRIKQILTNLMGNAVKFTDEGKLTLIVTDIERTAEDCLLRFEVQDSGIGIPAEQAQHIFDAFRQADDSITRKYGGTGLGLAITEQLVTLMGGKLQVESHYQEGSRFWFELSFKFAADAVVVVPEKDSQDVLTTAVTDNALKVLVVEDNKVNQAVAKAMLTSLGYDVVFANNGQSAVELFNPNAHRIVLMDCHMPVMDGFTATRLIRKIEQKDNLPPTPIVALTANAMEGDEESCLAAGMDDFISKPYTLKDLSAKLKRWN